MSKLYRNVQIPKKELMMLCDCMSEHYIHFVKFERDIWDDEDGESDQLYVTIGSSQMSRWRDRFSAAWKLVRFGEYENHGVLMDSKQLEHIKSYITDVLEHWNRNSDKKYYLSDEEVKKIEENPEKIDGSKFVGVDKHYNYIFNVDGKIIKIKKVSVEDSISLTTKL